MTEYSRQYESKYQVRFVDELGDGKDGRVFKTAHGHAVKFLYDPQSYAYERRAYQILRQQSIDEISGFQIPRLVRHDDSLLAIEMTIVQAPFIIDFAATRTPQEFERLEFTDDVMDEREQHWAEVFEDDWPLVQSIRSEFLGRTGLLLLDLSLNNIRFE